MKQILWASLALGLAACQPAPSQTYGGYVEGEYVYLSAPQAGYLTTLAAPRGSTVQAGQTLFTVEAQSDRYAVDEAAARQRAASARAGNLQQGRRSEEVASLQASLAAAEAALEQATRQLAREQQLAASGFVSTARVDDARNAQSQALAQRDSLRAQLQLARQPLGRQAEAQAAQADASAAGAQLAQKAWLLARQQVQAPQGGVISDTYYRAGEWVPAGKPVASLLPANGRRLRFFVPQPVLAQLAVGGEIEALCDGCAAPVRGRIDFIANQAEYTPPVIYSEGRRDKLVFRVEALPLPGQPLLPPGLPLSVRLPAKGAA